MIDSMLDLGHSLINRLPYGYLYAVGRTQCEILITGKSQCRLLQSRLSEASGYAIHPFIRANQFSQKVRYAVNLSSSWTVQLIRCGIQFV